jgi:endonuclease III
MGGARPRGAGIAGFLQEVDRRLRKQYRTAPLGNLPDPLDELVFIQLSIRTRDGSYLDTYENLRDLVDGDWERLLTTPEDALLGVLRGGGMARVKVDRLKRQIAAIREWFGSATLDPLHDFTDQEAESFLRGLPGVGSKAARCVLLYSLNRQVFPVDSHCLRVLIRLGVADPALNRKAAHDVLQPLVPGRIRHSLHVNLIHHGRQLCYPRSPDCQRCPLLDLCPTGVERTGEG